MAAVMDFVEAWRRTIIGDDKSWVVFSHGTCVVLVNPHPDADLASEAIEILREYGPVHIGSPAADFGTITLESGLGFVVYGHHTDVLSFVGSDEIDEPQDLTIGLFGRHKRDQDGRDLQVIHVEDRRSSTPV